MLGEQQNGTDKENKKRKKSRKKQVIPPRNNNVSFCHFSHQPAGADLHKALTKGRLLKR